jgi:hypothetical protein
MRTDPIIKVPFLLFYAHSEVNKLKHAKHAGSSGNAGNFYSGGDRLDFQLEHLLSGGISWFSSVHSGQYFKIGHDRSLHIISNSLFINRRIIYVT